MSSHSDTMEIFDPQREGWVVMEDSGFIGLVGPVWEKNIDGEAHFAFLSQAKHKNRRGMTQGGMLMTFADRAMGATARAATHQLPQATVQLNYQFIDGVRIGELVTAKCKVLRQTKSLIFVNGEFFIDEKIVGAAQGVWKILSNPDA